MGYNPNLAPHVSVPSFSKPSASIPTSSIDNLKYIKYNLAPGNPNIKIKVPKARHIVDLGDLIFGGAEGTKQLKQTLIDNGVSAELRNNPLINRLLGLHFMLNERYYEPISRGDLKTVFINTLETFGNTLDTVANPVKSQLPVAGGQAGLESFQRSMGWLEDEYRKQYQWDTGNFFVDLIGEIFSDPLTVVELGTGALAKSGSKSLDKASTQTIGKLVKDTSKNYLDDAAQVLARNLKRGLTSEDTVKAIIKDYSDEVSLLKRTLSNTSQTDIKQLTRIKNQIDTYQSILDNPKTVRELRKLVEDLRYTAGYKNYLRIARVQNTVSKMDEVLTYTAMALAPHMLLTKIVFDKIAVPEFRALWNSAVRKMQSLNQAQLIKGNPNGAIKPVKEHIKAVNRAMYPEVYTSLEEILSKYKLNVDRIQQVYVDKLKSSPVMDWDLRKIDESFLDYLKGQVPEFRTKSNLKFEKPYKTIMEEFKPKQVYLTDNLIESASITKPKYTANINVETIPIEDYIARVIKAIQESALAQYAAEEMMTQSFKKKGKEFFTNLFDDLFTKENTTEFVRRLGQEYTDKVDIIKLKYKQLLNRTSKFADDITDIDEKLFEIYNRYDIYNLNYQRRIEFLKSRLGLFPNLDEQIQEDIAYLERKFNEYLNEVTTLNKQRDNILNDLESGKKLNKDRITFFTENKNDYTYVKQMLNDLQTMMTDVEGNSYTLKNLEEYLAKMYNEDTNKYIIMTNLLEGFGITQQNYNEVARLLVNKSDKSYKHLINLLTASKIDEPVIRTGKELNDAIAKVKKRSTVITNRLEPWDRNNYNNLINKLQKQNNDTLKILKADYTDMFVEGNLNEYKKLIDTIDLVSYGNDQFTEHYGYVFEALDDFNNKSVKLLETLNKDTEFKDLPYDTLKELQEDVDTIQRGSAALWIELQSATKAGAIREKEIEPYVNFIRQLYSTTREAARMNVVRDVDELVNTQAILYTAKASEFFKFKTIDTNVSMAREAGIDNILLKLSDRTSSTRDRMADVINVLLKSDDASANLAASNMRKIIEYLDNYDAMLVLNDSLDSQLLGLPVAGLDNVTIDGELANCIQNILFDYIRNNSDWDKYTKGQTQAIAQSLTNKFFYEQDSRSTNFITNFIEENLSEKEFPRYSIERIEKVDEIYNNLINDIRDTYKTSLDQYIDILTIDSAYHGHRLSFYQEFDADAIASMQYLGQEFKDIIEFLEDNNVAAVDIQDVDSFIRSITKVDLNELTKETKFKLQNKYIELARSGNLDSSEVDSFLASTIEDTTNLLENAVRSSLKTIGDFNKALNGFKYNHKSYNVLPAYITLNEFDNMIRDIVHRDNVYDMSISSGILSAKKTKQLVGSSFNKNLFFAKPDTYFQLQTLFSDALDHVKNYGTFKVNTTTTIINNLLTLFKRYPTEWGFKDLEPLSNAFREYSNKILGTEYNQELIERFFGKSATDLEIEHYIYAWDYMLNNQQFFDSKFSSEYLSKGLSQSVNSKIDFYSNPRNFMLDLQKTLNNPDISIEDLDRLIDAALEEETGSYLDSIYLGVNAKLTNIIKDANQLKRFSYAYQIQQQELTHALDKLRALESIRTDTRFVNRAIKDKKVLNELKNFGITKTTRMNDPKVLKLLWRERQQSLYSSFNSWSAKEIRHFIDIATDGYLFYKGTHLSRMKKETLESAGLVIEKINNSNNVYIVRRTSNEVLDPSIKLKYTVLDSYFPEQQQLITNILKENRNLIEFKDTMSGVVNDLPNEIFTGAMLDRNVLEIIEQQKQVMDFLGNVEKQKTYKKINENGVNMFYTNKLPKPNCMFIGEDNLFNEVTDLYKDAIFERYTNYYPSTSNILKSVINGTISAIKRTDNVNKYLQMWLNEDFFIGNQMFRHVLENASDKELKDLFGRSGAYEAVVVKLDRQNKPHIYKLYIDNQKQLADAIEQNAIVMPKEVYRNAVLVVNKGMVDDNLMSIVKRLTIATYKTFYLSTPGFLFRNALDSLIYKNANSEDGIPGLGTTVNYEIRAAKELEWYDNITRRAIKLSGDNTYNRSNVVRVLKTMSKEDRDKYALMDMFMRSSASGGPSKILEEFMINYRLQSGISNIKPWEQWYDNKILNNTYTKSIMNVNDKIEQISRYSLFLYLVEHNASVDKAIRKVVETHFDYAMRGPGLDALEKMFWFSTFPINNFMYYMNEGLTKNPSMLKAQMDMMEQSYNGEGYSWEDVRNNDYLFYNLVAGNVHMRLGKDKHLIIKTGSSVFDFFNMITRPLEAWRDRANPFLSVLFNINNKDYDVINELNPVSTQIRNIQKIASGKSMLPSIYTVYQDRDKMPRKRYKRAYNARYNWYGNVSTRVPKIKRPRKLYFKKPTNVSKYLSKGVKHRFYLTRSGNIGQYYKNWNSSYVPQFRKRVKQRAPRRMTRDYIHLRK